MLRSEINNYLTVGHSTMPEVASDIEIARAAELQPIEDIAVNLDIPPDALYRYGPHKAKLSYDFITSLADRPNGKAGAGHGDDADAGW